MQRILIHARNHQVQVEDVKALLLNNMSAERAPSSLQISEVSAAISQWLDVKALEKHKYGHLYGEALQMFERPLLQYMMEHYDGNQLRVAEHLGINRNTLRKKLVGLALLSEKPSN